MTVNDIDLYHQHFQLTMTFLLGAYLDKSVLFPFGLLKKFYKLHNGNLIDPMETRNAPGLSHLAQLRISKIF